MRVTFAERRGGTYPRGKTSELLSDDEICASRLRGLLSSAIASMLRTCIDHSDAARMQWLMVANKHRERWAQGDLDGVIPVLSDLLPWIRQSGVNVADNADVLALFRDPSFDKMRKWIPAIDHDPKIFELFRQLAGKPPPTGKSGTN